MIPAPGLFAVAILVLGAAHVLRAVRWTLLFPVGAIGRRFNLLLGLGFGYAANAVLPLRLGELLRAWIVSRRERARLPLVLATIVAERLADLVAIGIILGAGAVGAGAGIGNRIGDGWAFATAALFVGIAGIVFALAVVVHRSPRFRRGVWRAASLFNDRLRIGIVDLVWTTSELLTGGVLWRWRFLVATLAMWATYAASYLLAGRAIGLAFPQVAEALLQPLRSSAGAVGQVAAEPERWWLLLFVAAPVLLILLYGQITHRTDLRDRIGFILRHGRSERGRVTARSDRFGAASSYENFLAALFSGEDQKVSSFGLEAIDDCVVHRLFNGGSDAITALVEADGDLLIRKFALGGAAGKLKVQADWLRAHAAPDLPLTRVVAEKAGARRYSYDMPLVTPANDFYDVIHSAPIERSRALLVKVVDGIDRLHARTDRGEAADAEIDGYLGTKVVDNARTILAFAQGRLDGGRYRLNGAEHDLAEWDVLTDLDWLRGQIRRRGAATVHGDLTVENIIVAPGEREGFYVIDPNPENVFDTPLIDWAKLMQSLHLGYEGLNRGIHVDLQETDIRLSLARSQAYSHLHETVEAEARRRFGDDGLREIYFHEIVNYLRLTTYKIRQSEQKGIGFFACTSLLLRRYRDAHG